MSGAFVTTGRFAELAGMSDKRARRVVRQCFEGGAWHGARLQVRRVHASDTGTLFRYEVALDGAAVATILRRRLAALSGLLDVLYAPLEGASPADACSASAGRASRPVLAKTT